MREISSNCVRLFDVELNRRTQDNRAYMLRLSRENLMRNYFMEAGLWTAPTLPKDIHGGWESPTCQLRGHFTGHWLSAAAMLYQATGDVEIKGRADAMVEDLARCQKENGNGWAGSIPEKYLDWIARGKQVWAPHYTVHKTLMGLVDMYKLAGDDPLTNMHANTTIPEILGCAKAYEVTGEPRYKAICEAYWKCAVTNRGSYATGGQTCGEVWLPMHEQSARLGDKAQEHCTVYNMMRLANCLYLWTKDTQYADYIERNLYNGIMAQGYWRWRHRHGLHPDHPTTGLLTYFLPMDGGNTKGWATETEDFFCCHGTLVQANASLNRYFYYQDEQDVYICQFFDSDAELTVNGQKVVLRQRIDTRAGSFHRSSDSSAMQAIGSVTSKVLHNPEKLYIHIEVVTDSPVEMTLHFRRPFWAGEKAGYHTPDKRVWQNGDIVCYELSRKLWALSLEDDPERVAMMYGPITLAGLTNAECTLHTTHPEQALRRANEREWCYWTQEFLTTTEDTAIRFIPLYDVGYEPYSIYFRIRE